LKYIYQTNSLFNEQIRLTSNLSLFNIHIFMTNFQTKNLGFSEHQKEMYTIIYLQILNLIMDSNNKVNNERKNLGMLSIK